MSLTVESVQQRLPPRQTILIAGSVAVGLVVLVLVYLIWIRKPFEPLLHDASPEEAASIVSRLKDEGVVYRVSDDGRTILVRKNDAPSIRLDVLAGEGAAPGAVGFELFNKSDMGLTEFAQKINYQRALQGELERSIRRLDAIRSVRVHLSIPERSVFRNEQRPPKASVSVEAREGRRITPTLVEGIQWLVANGVPDLTPREVVVVDSAGRVLTGGTRMSADPRALSERTAVEQYYAARIRRALAGAYPADSFTVEVGLRGMGDERAEEVLSEWTPQARGFGLSVQVGAPPSLAGPDREEILALAALAIGSSSEVADEVALMDETLSPAGPSPAWDAAPASPGKADEVGNARFAVWMALAAMLALLGVLAAALEVRRRVRSRAGLNEEQREALAQRLIAALREADSHVVSVP